MSPQTIRVSCACLCRIEHQGRYLLLLNANRLQRKLYVLSPIGGALELYDLDRLVDFEARPEDPASSDLRLMLPEDKLPAFAEWFYAGEGRERSPLREMQEELVNESRLLPSLEPEQLAYDHLWTVEEQTFTMRRGQTGVLTHYFLEIYAVRFLAAAALGPLLALAPDSGATWVTAEQIDAASYLPVQVNGEQHQARVNGYYLLHAEPRPPADAAPGSSNSNESE
ncbi:MAG: hypothetical protein GYB65_19395 [Chloroflexi bacterium]|nr:hypothetical protein [Chloroflexota bacterium]